ncbi:reverse transcriptase domain-containing protein [Tanacetum coccineum]|uniref:RNA-directed DNA polymerase n=1 Tax=Tanacetum coccineum TaxID=301880 RepID=A0ABQ5EHB9_9ASTR
MTNLTNMLSKFVNAKTASSSGTGSLPSNTITNPKEDLKGITTRSGIAYQGPTIPTTTSSPKVVEHKIEVTKDTVPPTDNGSTKDVQPPVVQDQPHSKPIVAPISTPMPNQKTSIPFPLRRNNERRREKSNNQIEKFYKIFRDLSFEISFTDALMLMPKFASTLKALIKNKEKLSEMARTPLNENCSAVILNKLLKKLRDPGQFLIPCEFSKINTCNALADLGVSINLMPYSVWKNLSLPKLTLTCMTLELAECSISEPISITEDVYVTVGKFQFPIDFMVVDFEPDPRVPLILGRCFLKTSHALIDVYEDKITLRVGRESMTFYLDQTLRYTANYNHMTANRIDVIEMAYEEYSQEVLGFSNVISSGNPTLYYDPIVSTSSPTLTPFGDSDFLLLEEAGLFLALKDDPTSPEIPIDPKDQEKITFTCLYGTFAYRHMPFVLCNAPGTFQRCEDTNLCLNWEKSHFMVKEGIVLGHKISKNGIEVDKAKIDVIAKLPHPTTIKGFRSFLGHVDFYQHFIQDFSKIARLMTHLLEKETPFLFSKECIKSFNTLKRKLTKAPILIAPDWDLPFELMCDASDFAFGAVLEQRKNKHFQPIHYASKTITEAQAHYTTTKKELLAVVYAFEMFRSYLILSKSIVYTDHSAIKYIFAKKDAKPRLIRWIFLLQEFDVIIRDKKGAENLAADHLSKLENPHQDKFENKEITETFPSKLLDRLLFVLIVPHGLQISQLPCEEFHCQGNVIPAEKQVFQRCQTLLSERPLLVQNLCGSSKLKSHWSGPFTIAHVFPYGTVELSQNSGPNFKDCLGFLKPLVLMVLSFDHKSFKSSASFGKSIPILVSVGCQKPGHLAARLGCAKTKVASWDDLAFKLIILWWNVKHRMLQNVDPWLKFKNGTYTKDIIIVGSEKFTSCKYE